MNYFKKYYGIIVIFLLSYLAIQPLTYSGFFPMHDDTQPSRIYEMGKALKDGMLPVRWVYDLGYGYGYPIFNFYAPLAYYIGGIINIFGIDALLTTKIIMAFAIIFSGVNMYLLAKEFWGEFGGIISGALYLFAPYSAINIYVRGDLAESYAYAILPLVFLGIYKIFRSIKDNKLAGDLAFKKQYSNVWFWISITTLSYAALILAHNLTALMATPFIFITAILLSYILLKNKKIISARYIFVALVLGIGIAAFYWIPALVEIKYTNVMSQIGGKADYRLHFVCLNQLWDSPWGYGGSAPGCFDGMSFRIGKIHVLILMLSVLMSPFIFTKNKKYSLIIIFSFLLIVISVFLTLQPSQIIWQNLPIMNFFQYPWRFLVIIVFFSSFISGSIIWFLGSYLPIKELIKKETAQIIATVFIILAIIFLYAKLFTPQTITSKTVTDYINESFLRWDISKISDEYLPRDFNKPNYIVDVVKHKITASSTAEIKLLTDKTQEFSAKVTVPVETFINVNIAYFPAWQIFIDKTQAPFTVTNKGLNLIMPKGTHLLDIRFVQTPLENLANIITGFSIVALLIGIIRGKGLKI